MQYVTGELLCDATRFGPSNVAVYLVKPKCNRVSPKVDYSGTGVRMSRDVLRKCK
jgi:hypothetical protein